MMSSGAKRRGELAAARGVSVDIGVGVRWRSLVFNPSFSSSLHCSMISHSTMYSSFSSICNPRSLTVQSHPESQPRSSAQWRRPGGGTRCMKRPAPLHAILNTFNKFNNPLLGSAITACREEPFSGVPACCRSK